MKIWLEFLSKAIFLHNSKNLPEMKVIKFWERWQQKFAKSFIWCIEKEQIFPGNASKVF